MPACASQGAYRDDEGKPVVLDVVREAEERVAGSNFMEYLPIGGLKAFNELSVRLAYGDAAAALREGRVAAVQSLSGTGAQQQRSLHAHARAGRRMQVCPAWLPIMRCTWTSTSRSECVHGRWSVAERLTLAKTRLLPADGGVHGTLHAGRTHPHPQAHLVQPSQVRAPCSFPPHFHLLSCLQACKRSLWSGVLLCCTQPLH